MGTGTDGLTALSGAAETGGGVVGRAEPVDTEGVTGSGDTGGGIVGVGEAGGTDTGLETAGEEVCSAAAMAPTAVAAANVSNPIDCVRRGGATEGGLFSGREGFMVVGSAPLEGRRTEGVGAEGGARSRRAVNGLIWGGATGGGGWMGGGGTALAGEDGVFLGDGAGVSIGGGVEFSFCSDEIASGASEEVEESFPLEVTGGTTVSAGGVLEKGVASRAAGLAGRMMRLDLLTGVAGVDGVTSGLTATGAAGTGGTGTGDGVCAMAGTGVAATTGSGLVKGGWKRRADLRNSGSIGGVRLPDFFAVSDAKGSGAGVTWTGGGMRGADLRIKGSTGGIMGEDFFVAGSADVGIRGRLGWIAAGGGGTGVGVTMATVLEAGRGTTGGAEATAETSPATGMEAVRRGKATEGGRMVGVDLTASAAGGTEGFAVGETMGADFATGRGKLGGVAGETTSGGVTVETGLEEKTEVPGGWMGVEGGSGGGVTRLVGAAEDGVSCGIVEREGTRGG